ncbi:UPF0280 family protein [Rhizobium sp. KVB221]|uniref:UPF0280 family protein n=1 Tax=Rhizobium setariae TaxID=2801340 RepID=A0A936YU79_9HYPH|nr:UPF0280 family protein [Rhizobium setariae]MBL0375146.1 UPF0280 family protein [Rhizobium setariae]
MNGPVANYLDGDQNGRLHMQHGPIDLIIGVDGAISLELESYQRAHAYAMANRRFKTVLEELVAELPLLKSRAWPDSPMPKGTTARRMMRAVLPYADTHFITPMAAVAGAVADEVLAAMLAGFTVENRPKRIYVNNGGDIAIHLDAPAEFHVGMSREDRTGLGSFTLDWRSPTRGIATSGRGGRSLSMGIADSVTILACNAAEADAAATIVANEVDLPDHAAITRMRASDVVDDSDLGDRLVVRGCGMLTALEVDTALELGVEEAERLRLGGLIQKAAIFLKDQGRIVAAPIDKIDFHSDDHDHLHLEMRRHA